MLSLTIKELNLHQNTKVYYIYRKNSEKRFQNIKIIEKLETIVVILGNIETDHIVFLI